MMALSAFGIAVICLVVMAAVAFTVVYMATKHEE